MELEKAQEMQRVRAEQVAALTALFVDNAPEAETSATLADRYFALAARLNDTVQFYPTRDGVYERTQAFEIAAGAEPLPVTRLRFARQSHDGGVPSTMIAEWIHSPTDAMSVDDDVSSVFADLAYGEVFAREVVGKTEVIAADEGTPFPPMAGEDPRPVAARLTLLEQSVDVLEAVLRGNALPGAGNPQ